MGVNGGNGVISVESLEAILSDVAVPILTGRGEATGKLASASPREIYRNYSEVIPRGIVSRLSAKSPSGDRSKVLWKISRGLLEVGLSPGEVVVLVEKSVWNKFGEDRSRLWADVNKAARTVVASEPQPRPEASTPSARRSGPWSIPLDSYLAVESRDPQWMIEGLWSDKSHGIIAGEPKTRKSYVAIDIALSVATGTKCLNYFPVTKPGPVLVVQEEISDAEMRKRLRYIATAKGLGGKVEKHGDEISVHMPQPVPLYLRNRQQCDLSDEDTFRTLHEHITEKDIKLLILDPLQLMLGQVDENKASEVRPILYNFLQLKEETGCAVMILHHYAKASGTNPRQGGQRMLGSQAFHGWVESALYLSKNDKYETEVEREFRNFDPIEGFSIAYTGGNEKYEVEVAEHKQPKRKSPPTKFDRFCLDNPGVPIKALAKHFEISDVAIRKRINTSEYLELAERKNPKGGRPIVVVETMT